MKIEDIDDSDLPIEILIVFAPGSPAANSPSANGAVQIFVKTGGGLEDGFWFDVAGPTCELVLNVTPTPPPAPAPVPTPTTEPTDDATPTPAPAPETPANPTTAVGGAAQLPMTGGPGAPSGSLLAILLILMGVGLTAVRASLRAAAGRKTGSYGG